MRNLSRRPDRQLFLAREVTGQDGASLQCNRRQALMHHTLFYDVVRRLERRVDVSFARGQLVSDVVAVFLVDSRTALCGGLNIDHNRQLLVINHDQVNGVPSSVAVGSDHSGDRLAYKDHVIRGKYAVVRHLETGQLRGARDWSNARHVLAGIDSNNTRSVCSFAYIDALNARVRVHRAQERDVKGVRQLDVIHIVPESADQSRVLCALHTLSDILLPHTSPPYGGMRDEG